MPVVSLTDRNLLTARSTIDCRRLWGLDSALGGLNEPLRERAIEKREKAGFLATVFPDDMHAQQNNLEI